MPPDFKHLVTTAKIIFSKDRICLDPLKVEAIVNLTIRGILRSKMGLLRKMYKKKKLYDNQ